MKKVLKYLIWIVLIVVAVTLSIYTRPLSEVTAEKEASAFDAATYASHFFEENAANVEAINVSDFLNEAKANLDSFTNQKGNKLGISNDYYFMVEGSGTVIAIDEENLLVQFENTNQSMQVATDFIFGNTIREASQMANIGDYQNTMDFNNISVEVNKLIRERVIPPVLEEVKINDAIYVKGGVRVDTKNPNLDSIRIIPIMMTIQ